MKTRKEYKPKLGFARIVILILLLSSCSAKINLTPIQREQKKLDRFNISTKDLVLYGGAAFVGYGVTKNYIVKK